MQKRVPNTLILKRTGKVQHDAILADTLLQIIRKAIQGYRDHMGEALDPSLIFPEEPVTDEVVL